MLDVANMAIHCCQMMGQTEIEACYNMVTWHGAKTLNIKDQYGIAVGKPANLMVLDGGDRYDILRRRATVRYVISQGTLISQTVPPTHHWFKKTHSLNANEA